MLGEIRMRDMKMRAQFKDGITEVKALISHPMETGQRKNANEETIPAHFIQLLTATVNDKIVLEAQWGTGVSKNRYLTFYLRDANDNDTLRLTSHENHCETATGAEDVSLGMAEPV